VHKAVYAGYPQNYLAGESGAKALSTAKLTGPFEPNALLSDGPVSKGRFAFAAEDQLRVFTVDLGQARCFDRIQLGTSGNPRSVAIEACTHGPDGPFKRICEARDPVHLQILRLPVTTARWLRFDFGRGSHRMGVHSLRIYKGYEHPQLTEVTKSLYERIKPDHPGIQVFRSQANAGNWRVACAELRAYFASAHRPDIPSNPAYDLTRAKNFVAGNLNFAGLARSDQPPIDWSWMKTTDWYEHKNFLNRGSPLGVLADACYHTDSPFWAEQFRNILYDWIDENPKPEIMSGPDYPTWRTLDTAARLSWLVSRFAEVTAAQHVDDVLWANYLYSIWEHVDYLKNDDFSGGNWLSTITSAVTHAAQQFPIFQDRKTWLEYGKDGFERNVMRDILPDGKEFEDAPGYICMAYNGMLATLQTLDQEGVVIDPQVRLRLSKVQDFLAAVTQPNGIMPFIGDWGACPPYALPTAMQHFPRDDIRYVLSKGQSGVPPSASSVHFPHGGWTIMRSAYAERPYEHARHLVFKSSSGAHGHLDVLSITAYAFGRELLIDPGIRSYERADVQRYLQTAYHNTVCIDRHNQPRVSGKSDGWFSNPALDYVSGIFIGYPDISHRRSIVFIKPNYWIVRDRITGSGDHTYDQNWHFPVDAKPVVDNQTAGIRTQYEEGGNILIAPVGPAAFDCEPFDFFVATKRMTGGKSDTAAKGFRYSTSGTPPKMFDVLLYPYVASLALPISAERLTSDSDPSKMTGTKVTVGTKSDYIFVTPSDPAQASFARGDIQIAAQILLIRTSTGRACFLAGKDVRKVVFNGKVLLQREEPILDLFVDLR